MTIGEFINKYSGQTVDTDGYYGGQCMDLMHKYCQDVLGLPLSLFAAPTAYEAYKAANDDRFDKITNTPTGVPQGGDIIFWNTGIGSAGHVAIFVEGDANSFKSFDQNFPTGSKCHIQDHTYKSVAGWLRPKNTQSDSQSIIDELREQRDNNWNLVLAEQEKNNELTKQLQDEQRKNQDLREINDGLTKTDADLGVQLLDAQHKVNDYNEVLRVLQAQDLKTALEAICALKQPVDEQVKPLENHALDLQKALEDFIYKRVPQSKSLISKILDKILWWAR